MSNQTLQILFGRISYQCACGVIFHINKPYHIWMYYTLFHKQATFRHLKCVEREIKILSNLHLWILQLWFYIKLLVRRWIQINNMQKGMTTLKYGLTEMLHHSLVIPCPVTLFWQWVNQFVLELSFICRTLGKGALTTNLKSLVRLGQEIEHRPPRHWVNALPWGYWCWCKYSKHLYNLCNLEVEECQLFLQNLWNVGKYTHFRS